MEEYALIVMNWVKNPQNWEGLLDSIAGFFGVTSANGRAFLGVGLVIAGIIALCLVIVLLWKAWRRFPLVRVILLAAAAVCADLVTGFKVSKILGITSMYGRIGLAVVIGIIIVALGIKIRNTESSYTLPPSPPEVPETKPIPAVPIDQLDYKMLQSDIKKLNDTVYWRIDVERTLHMSTGKDALFFECLGKLLMEKRYHGKFKGTLEGRVKFSGAKVKHRRKEIEGKGVKSDEILVTVFIPRGYFKLDFDLSDVEDKNYAGWLTQYYTPAEIRKHFDEDLPRVISEFIEQNDLIAETKKAAETSIQSTVLEMIRNLVEPAQFPKYEVEVVFRSPKWRIFRGVSKTSIAMVSEKTDICENKD